MKKKIFILSALFIILTLICINTYCYATEEKTISVSSAYDFIEAMEDDTYDKVTLSSNIEITTLDVTDHFNINVNEKAHRRLDLNGCTLSQDENISAYLNYNVDNSIFEILDSSEDSSGRYETFKSESIKVNNGQHENNKIIFSNVEIYFNSEHENFIGKTNSDDNSITIVMNRVTMYCASTPLNNVHDVEFNGFFKVLPYFQEDAIGFYNDTNVKHISDLVSDDFDIYYNGELWTGNREETWARDLFFNETDGDDRGIIITLKTYTVNYVINVDGYELDPTEAEINSFILPPDFEIPGYSQEGWYKDQNYTNLWNFEEDRVTSDVTLYGKYELITTFNVTDDEFGANPNDQEDDYAAINFALAKAINIDEHITVIVPAGTYYISGELSIYGETTLQLDKDAVIISTCPYNHSTFITAYSKDGNDGAHGGYTRAQNIEISGGKWYRENTTDKLMNAFIFWHSQDVRIHDLEIYNCTNHIITVSASKDVTLTNVKIYDQRAYTGDDEDFWKDIDRSNPAEVKAKYSFVEAIHADYANEEFEGGAVPIDGTAACNITLDNCYFENILAGIGNHHTAPNNKAQNITIKNSTFKNVQYGPAIDSASFNNLMVSNNHFYNTALAVYASDSTGTIKNNHLYTKPTDVAEGGRIRLNDSEFTVNDNIIEDSYRYAISVSGGKATIYHNTITKVSGDDCGSGIGAHNTTYINIYDNTLTDIKKYGIFIENGSGDWNVKNNNITAINSPLENSAGIYVKSPEKNGKVENNTTSGFDLGISLVSTKGTILENTINSARVNGINVQTNSNVTIDSNIINSAGINAIDVNTGSVNALNNIINSVGRYGINLNGTTSSSIKSNTLTEINKYGIFLTNCSGTNAINENSIVALNNPEDGSTGIYVKSSGTNNTVNGNTNIIGFHVAISFVESGGTISNNTVNSSKTNAIQAQNTSNVTIDGNTVNNVAGSAIYINNCSATISNNKIDTVANHGIQIPSGSEIRIEGNTLNNVAKHGMNIDPVTGLNILNNTLTNVKNYSIFVKNMTKAFTISQNNISGNESQTGITIQNCNGNATITKNTIKNSSLAGIYIDRSKGTINNNDVTSCSGDAVFVKGTSDTPSTFTINNNYLQTSSSSKFDLRLADISLNCTVKNNIYGNTGLKAAQTTTYTLTNANGLISVNGNWYYCKNGAVQTNYTGLVNHNGTWYYIQKGLLKWGQNTLVKHNGTWYYVKNSTLDWNFTGLTKYGGTWYYIQKGTLKWGVNTLVKYNGIWYYVKNSAIDWNYTGLFKFSGTWYYIQKGELKWGQNTLVKYSGTWYYVKNSAIDWNYTGLVKYSGSWYYIQKGTLKWGVETIVQYNGTWYYVKNSTLDWNFTGLCKYGSTTYYIQNGTLKWGYNGTITYNGKQYTIKNSKVV